MNFLWSMRMSYKIVTKTLPNEGTGRGVSKYPWSQLEVKKNNSFTIPARELVDKCANYSPNPPTSLTSTGYKISVRKNKETGDMDVFRVA
tara:strand:+ start:214 stop:483 length:270 start_codon:yes stop_codon:yes gene_type:complete